jgi:flap endonuclease-1
MGIKGLFKIIQEIAPNAIRACSFDSFPKAKVSIDMSLILYQYMRVNYFENENLKRRGLVNFILSNVKYYLMYDMTPVYVFDGPAPQMKIDHEKTKRRIIRESNEQKHAEALTQNNVANVEKYGKLITILTENDTSAIKQMLLLMGIPYVDAPSEAESQCSYMSRMNQVDFVASEDMDCFPFRCNRLVRHFKISQKDKCLELEYDKVLEGLDMTYESFVDFCILSGCDYLETIPRIGPKTALRIIREHGSLEAFVEENVLSEKYKIPTEWDFGSARELFYNPIVGNFDNLGKKPFQKENLIEFLVNDIGLFERNVNLVIKLLEKEQEDDISQEQKQEDDIPQEEEIIIQEDDIPQEEIQEDDVSQEDVPQEKVIKKLKMEENNFKNEEPVTKKQKTFLDFLDF